MKKLDTAAERPRVNALKFGERFRSDPMPTPSQASREEGVETGWGSPDRSDLRGRRWRHSPAHERRFRSAAAKAEVGWDQKSPGSSPGGATESPALRASAGLFPFPPARDVAL